MIKGMAIFTGGVVVGVLAGGLGGIVAGLVLHEIIEEDWIEKYRSTPTNTHKKESKIGRSTND